MKSQILKYILLTLTGVLLQSKIAAQGLPNNTWPAGTLITTMNDGGRISTFHRGHLILNGETGNTTTIYDISNLPDLNRVRLINESGNGHRWWKFGDVYNREYASNMGVGTSWVDLSDPVNPSAAPSAFFDQFDNGLETFPYRIENSGLRDVRSGQFYSGGLPDDGITALNSITIGNYLFNTPGDGGQSGVASYDISDPENPILLDVFPGILQYTTFMAVWRNNLVFMTGNSNNLGGNNMVVLDISDPTNLKFAWGLPDGPARGRYVFFQDEFAFCGRFTEGRKINMETREVVQTFSNAGGNGLFMGDFQWIPLGHILQVSSGEANGQNTFFFSHQDELDTRAPTVGHHFPLNNSTNQHVLTKIGIVINETLQDHLINDQTITVVPCNGDPISGTVQSSQMNVIQWVPDQPLEENTTYVVTVTSGILDVAGNPMEEYSFSFSTGSTVDLACESDTTPENQLPSIDSILSNPISPIITGTEVTFTADASDPDEDDVLEYRFDFGDGSTQTTWSIANSAGHIYDTPGNYLVQVQVRDNAEELVADVLNIVVVTDFPDNRPTQSGPIVVDEENRKVWIANPDNNSVTAIDADNLNVIGEFTVGNDPVGIAQDAEGNIWVASRDAGNITVLNETSGDILSTIDLGRGSQPYALVSDPEGEFIYASLFASGNVVKISTTTKNIVNQLDVFANPRAMAITSDGSKLFVTQFITENNTGKIARINLDTFTLDSNVEIAADTTSPNSGSAGRGIANYLGGIAIHPNNEIAWFGGKKDNVFGGSFISGEDLTFESTIRTIISSFNINTGQENLDVRVDIDNHNLPTGITIDPLGNFAFVTMLTNNRVVVIDVNTGLEVARADVGFAPSGLVIDTATNRLFVKNFLSRSVHIFDANQLITTGTQSLPLIAEVSTVSSELLNPQVLLGKQIFYNARDSRMTNLENSDAGYISCASCHIDGTQDGQVWDFTQRGEGLRNTISLRGRAGTGHGNIHWTGNFDEIHDFENDIRFSFGGKGFMTDQAFYSENRDIPLGNQKAGQSAELDALAAYIESLDTFDESPNKNNGSLTPQAIQGRNLFNSLQCANCHSGASFTNSKTGLLHDIGTLTTGSGQRMGRTLHGLDVPTLLDVWATPPYLHDGSEASIQRAISRHEIASNLSQEQLQQLEEYLLQLDGSEPIAANGISFELQVASQSTLGETISLSVSTDIPNITEVIYYVDDQVIGSATTAPFTVNFIPQEVNNYCVFVKALHDGMATISKDQTLSIVASGNDESDSNELLLTLQGEDFSDVQDGTFGNYILGFTGTGFLDMGGNNSFGEWQFESEGNGSGSLNIIYNNAFASSRSADLILNGTFIQEISFNSQGNCYGWQSVQIDNIDIRSGINTIRIRTSSVFGGVDIDYIEIALPNINTREFSLEGEEFVQQNGCFIGTHISGFSGTGFLDYGGDGSFGEWQFDNPASGSGSIEIVFGNGSDVDRSATIEINGQVIEDIPFSSNGNWENWQIYSVDGVNFVEGTNTITITANSTNGGPNIDILNVIVDSEATNSETYTLTVTNGSGSGDYAEGEVVTITAEAPSEGQIFDRWVGDISTVANVNEPNTTVAITTNDINLTASYKNVETILTYSLEGEEFTQQNGGFIGTHISGFSGTGFFDYGGNGSYGEWQFTSTEAGLGNINIIYGNGDVSARPGTVLVNGQFVNDLPFATNGDWANWQIYTVEDVNFVEGVNTIRVVANSDAGGPNLDLLEIEVQVDGSNRLFERNINRSKQVVLYPNPVENQVNIIGDGIIRISIYSITGRLIKTIKEVSDRTTYIDLSTVNSGMYLIKIKMKNKETLIRKLLIR